MAQHDPQEQLQMGLNIITVPSMTDPDKTYEVDIEAKTCTCPAFQKSHKPCKHLRSIPGVIPEPKNITMPDIRMALSAMIKCTRLRRTNEAAYWFAYLWELFPEERYRVCRRVLIMAGEDCVSIPVQASVGLWLKHGAKKDASFKRALTEVIRITKTANWWQMEEGLHYMEAWAEAYKQNKKKPYEGMSAESLTARLKKAIEEGNIVETFKIHIAIGSAKVMNKVEYNQLLLGIARKQSNPYAIKQASLILTHSRSLYGDENYEGQVLWWLLGQEFPGQTFPRVTEQEIESAMEFIKEHWSMATRLAVPSWCLDGVHTSGSDRRFGGIISSMVGCCRAYQHYGRLHPDDQWDKSFWG